MELREYDNEIRKGNATSKVCRKEKNFSLFRFFFLFFFSFFFFTSNVKYILGNDCHHGYHRDTSLSEEEIGFSWFFFDHEFFFFFFRRITIRIIGRIIRVAIRTMEPCEQRTPVPPSPPSPTTEKARDKLTVRMNKIFSQSLSLSKIFFTPTKSKRGHV